MDKDTNPRLRGARLSGVAIISFAIALMFVAAVPYIFGGNDDNDNEGAVLGADGEVDITSETSWTDIADKVMAELVGYNEVTVVSTTPVIITSGSEGEYKLSIPSGAKVIWEAEYSNLTTGITLGGAGTFVSDGNVISEMIWITTKDTVTATISGNIALNGNSNSTYAEGSSKLILNGDLTIYGPYYKLGAQNDGELTINGDVTFDGNNSYINPSGNGIVEINGDVTFEGNNSYIRSTGNGSIVINGDVTFEGSGSYIEITVDGSIVINGDVSLEGINSYIDTSSAGVLEINGDLTLHFYIDAWGSSTVTIDGDVLLIKDNSPRVKAYEHSIIEISGTLTFEGVEACIYSAGTVDIAKIVTFEREGWITVDGGEIFLRGGVTFDEEGKMEAGIGGEITIDGNVTALSIPDDNEWKQLMVLGDGGEITVNGNVKTSGVLAYMNKGTVTITGDAESTSKKAGVMFDTGGGLMTIEGKFTAIASNYVWFWDVDEADFVPVAKSAGVLNGEYYEWDGMDTVGGADPTLLKVKVSSSGGDGGGLGTTTLIIIAIIIAAIIGLLFFFFWTKRDKDEEEEKP